MNIRTVVPWRADGGRRDELWTFGSKWWADRTDLKPIEAPSPPGPFNRAAAINRAAGGDWDLLVILDADVVLEPEQVDAAIERARATGRMTLAYERYVGMNPQMTEQVLEGFVGNWARGSRVKMTDHVSSFVVVPRALWETVGGFDERFVGWGADDSAFASACRVLGGGIERVEGTVWHLYHAPQIDTHRGTPNFRASKALVQRYWEATDPHDMRRLLAERDVSDGVALVVVTDGRRECIAKAIDSADEHLQGLPVMRRVISDDSGDPEYVAWLRIHFGDCDIVTTERRTGFAGAVARAWDVALGSGQRHIFWLEDDFTFTEDVDLAGMAAVLDTHPHILQMALQRQPWFKEEKAAGGVVAQNPDGYTEHSSGVHRWLEHRLFYTTNPHLVSRRVLSEHVWPRKRGSEILFAREALVEPNVSAYWGRLTDGPRVIHDGARSGKGY